MPGHDKTGPLGAGPLTGRGMGLCTNNETVEHRNSIRSQLRGGNFSGGGRGNGSGRGLYGGQRQGFQRRTGFNKNIPDPLFSEGLNMRSEIMSIKNQLKALTDQLSTVMKNDET